MVPEGWNLSNLNDLLERVIDYRGISVPKATSGIPLITARNVRSGYLDFSEQEFIDEAAYEDWMNRGLPSSGDVLFTTEAPLGNVCRFPRTGRFALGQRTVALRTNDKADSEFILQFLLSTRGQRAVQLKSTGSTAKGIKSSELKKLKVIHPSSLREQSRIGLILSTWDHAIAATEQLLANSEQKKKALIQQLLTGKKRLPGFHGNWASVKLKELLVEEKERNTGGRIERVLSVSNKHGFILPEIQFSKRVASDDLTNYKVVRKGQYGYNPSRINVGSYARLDAYEVGVLSPMYVVFSVDQSRLNSDYFLSWMQSNEASQRISASIQGSVRDSVGFDALCALPFRLPPLKEQVAVAKVVSTCDSQLSGYHKVLGYLTEEKKALMQQLLTGKRRVRID